MARLNVNRRLVGLVLAIVLAGAGTFALYQYVTRVEDRALEEVELAQVYVAAGTIPVGTSAQAAIEQGLIRREEVPRRVVADNAIGSLEQIQGLVATATITRGEQILTTRFGSAGALETGLIEIPEDRQAVSVEVGILPGVAGFVRPGDHVSILATLDEPDPTDPDPAATRTRVEFVIHDVMVLAVGQRVLVRDEQGRSQGYAINETNDRYLFTVAVAPPDVERLLLAFQEVSIWFTLLPEGQAPAVTQGRTLEDLLIGTP
ncbi:MAG TPA: Flp pilus assembly protein CpaB [Nitriliruptorales bacterium]